MTLSRSLRLLIRREGEVIEIRAELRVEEQAGRALAVANRIRLVDQPGGGLGLADRPRLAACPYLSVCQVLDPQLESVPRVGLPRERCHDRASRFGFPGFQLQPLRVALQDQG